MKILEKDVLRKIITVLIMLTCGVLTRFGPELKLTFGTGVFGYAVLCIFFFVFFDIRECRGKRRMLFAVICGIVFSISSVYLEELLGGTSLYELEAAGQISGIGSLTVENIIAMALKSAGWSFAMLMGTTMFLHMVRMEKEEAKKKTYLHYLALFGIVYGVIWFISIPGGFSYDTCISLSQYFGLRSHLVK